jgi:hypothetical protein
MEREAYRKWRISNVVLDECGQSASILKPTLGQRGVASDFALHIVLTLAMLNYWSNMYCISIGSSLTREKNMLLGFRCKFIK